MYMCKSINKKAVSLNANILQDQSKSEKEDDK